MEMGLHETQPTVSFFEKVWNLKADVLESNPTVLSAQAENFKCDDSSNRNLAYSSYSFARCNPSLGCKLVRVTFKCSDQ